MKSSTDSRPFVPLVDQQVLSRLQDAIRASRTGARPPLSAAELARFASELRPGMPVGLHIRETDTPERFAIVIRLDRPGKQSDALHALTPRERDVATLIAEGMTNREIAARLGLAVSTVKDHVHRILFRMKVTSRLAVARAVFTDRSTAAAADDC
jgi:DNA-binding NarL/FixJ family response regulator